MFDAGSIVGRLVLDTSGFTSAATRATNKVESIGQSVISTTRLLSRAASTLTFLGAGITAPLILAFKSAEKYSNSARTEIEKINNAVIGFRVSIAESLLPMMHKMGNAIADLAQRWQSLSPQLRENMLRTALLTGIFLTLGGVISMVALKILMLAGYVIKLAGAFAAFAIVNPELLLIRVAIVGIVFAMFKWKEVGDIVMNTFQIIFNMARIGFNSMLYLVNNITSAFFAATTGALKFGAAIALNKDAKNSLNELAQGAWKLSQRYSELANTNLKNIADIGMNTFNVLTTGQSDFSRGFEDMKSQAQSWIGLFKDLGSKEIGVKNWQEASKTFAQGWQDALDKTRADLSNWGAMATTVFEGSVQTLSSGFSNLGMSLIGMGDDIKTVFANLGKSIIQMFMDIVMNWLAMKAIMGIADAVSGFFGWGGSASTGTSNISGSAFNTSGLSLGGFAEGTDSVPYNGNYKLHEGEKVTPKYDASKGNGVIELTLYNNITPEAIAAAMSGKEGAGVIVNTIDTNALHNGSIRRTIRRK
jgi:hypothetical protein